MSTEQTSLVTPDKALANAIEILGGPSKAGRALGVSHEAVRRWLSGENRLVAERAVDIEKATGGRITRHDLRPDVCGPAPVS